MNYIYVYICTMYVYIIENKINGFWYIGKRSISSKSNDFNRYYGGGTRIRKAVLEYGKNNFTKAIIEECSNKEELAERELFWIKKYLEERSLETCYNILLDCNYVGRKKGFRQTKEHIEKRLITARNSGIYTWNDERKKKQSEYMKSKTIWNKGKKCPQIAKAKYGENNPNAKKVIDKKTNIIYNTVKEAADANNIKITTLWQYLAGKRKNKTNMNFYA